MLTSNRHYRYSLYISSLFDHDCNSAIKRLLPLLLMLLPLLNWLIIDKHADYSAATTAAAASTLLLLLLLLLILLLLLQPFLSNKIYMLLDFL
jgi:hypothetical protein